IIECFFSCEIEKDGKSKEGKPCKPKGDKDKDKKCSGGWRCKIKMCLKI
uniref:U1-theraphotoxin-Agm1a n=1 Tax=Acanthoscurria gomesiana TaxID=115339 RepID=TXA1_ACAGO|nr:RecName: Full=U1-theraphotoxin-Agm1a; Short=U1-TRTX-Agm1a [Acanthoscurria gomesiana]